MLRRSWRVGLVLLVLLGCGDKTEVKVSDAPPAANEKNPGNPVTGDWLVIRAWPDARRTVEAVLPRRTSIVLPPAGGLPRGPLGSEVGGAGGADAVAAVEWGQPGQRPVGFSSVGPP